MLNIKKRPISFKSFPTGNTNYPVKHLQSLPLDPAKVDDVHSLLQFIPPMHHDLYHQLRKEKGKVTATAKKSVEHLDDDIVVDTLDI